MFGIEGILVEGFQLEGFTVIERILVYELSVKELHYMRSSLCENYFHTIVHLTDNF